jgi:thermostable 8-oxoguanine DNA glycosylase
MTIKVHLERVNPDLAISAMSGCTQRTHLYTEYILRHYRLTGQLAPDCDARDLYAWYEVNMPVQLAAITMPSQKRR